MEYIKGRSSTRKKHMKNQAGQDSKGICAFLLTTLVVKHPRRSRGLALAHLADVLASP